MNKEFEHFYGIWNPDPKNESLVFSDGGKEILRINGDGSVISRGIRYENMHDMAIDVFGTCKWKSYTAEKFSGHDISCTPILTDGFIYCSYCGKEINVHGFIYCPYCGKEIEDSED